MCISNHMMCLCVFRCQGDGWNAYSEREGLHKSLQKQTFESDVQPEKQDTPVSGGHTASSQLQHAHTTQLLDDRSLDYMKAHMLQRFRSTAPKLDFSTAIINVHRLCVTNHDQITPDRTCYSRKPNGHHEGFTRVSR